MAITAAQALAASASDGGSTRLEVDVAPRFAAGDRIRTRNINPRGHTRLPLYLRNCVGVVAADLGVFVFPDTHAHGGDQKPQHVYSVHFSAKDVWGREGGERDTLVVDMWDDYMDPV
jgi:nitrile hydratase